ncbi:1573_t:CDS:1, partial [Ambispora gerdemannii]
NTRNEMDTESDDNTSIASIPSLPRSISANSTNQSIISTN